MTTNIQPNFKGSYTRTENGTPYYKTNSGIKAGSTVAALSGLSSCYYFATKKPALGMSCLLSSALSVACGAAVDYIRNKNAQKSADLIRQTGMNNAFAKNEHLELADSGRPYYNSNDGLKYGGLLGAAMGLITGTFMNSEKVLNESKDMGMKKTFGSKRGNIIKNVCSTALCGLIMGAITDHFNNSSARKNS